MTSPIPVQVACRPQDLPTYPLPPASPHPMFFEKRVYQGSSGKVYPLPFHERLAERASPTAWDTVFLENEYLKLELLPQLGGRIHRGHDKTRDYEFFYHNPVIKPALVGLAGPWLSGGVEFNWPQHHRPSTYMPAQVHVEHHGPEDPGAVTVWLSEHEPMHRMKGMHGITLRPGSARIQLTARLYNRTPMTRTFLWWANVAARVHDRYQSFFPPDVSFVADHAGRAMSSFPVARGHYYGIDYGAGDEPGGGTDLTWYKNIPVPTSYMVVRTDYDFFGGYDHEAGAGFVHVADRFISPGKKQWTWGNDAFGRAWDRELTEPDETGQYPPYIELMAGVYTDNQPDFTYLQPYETKTFTQSWWPIQGIGVVHQADEHFALQFSAREGEARVGLAAAERHDAVQVRLVGDGNEPTWTRTCRVGPGEPMIACVPLPGGVAWDAWRLEVFKEGHRCLVYRPPTERPVEIPPPATAPPPPAEAGSTDALFFYGEHLEQYRHPTRRPEDYWQEALRRDPGDARAHLALGRRLLDRGLLAEAEAHLQQSIARQTVKHPNPLDGEAWYLLGLCRQRRDDPDDARRLLTKATWSRAWRGPAHLRLGLIAMRRQQWEVAVEQFDEALIHDARQQQATAWWAAALRQAGQSDRAVPRLEALLAEDPLDALAGYELIVSARAAGRAAAADEAERRWRRQFAGRSQILLDVGLDYVAAGLADDALAVLEHADDRQAMVGYTRAWITRQTGREAEARDLARQAAEAGELELFPVRPEEESVLRAVVELSPSDGRASYLLGALLYDRRRHDEAVTAWEDAVRSRPDLAAAHRCLGMAYFNQFRDGERAREAYRRARQADPADSRLLFEADQLDRVLAVDPAARLVELERHRGLVEQRDDLRVTFADLLNIAGRHAEALAVLESAAFHPWEGGEGKVLGQYRVARLALGRAALAERDADAAEGHFAAVLNPPANLGETHHPLAATADVAYWRGRAASAGGRSDAAARHYASAASASGDFAEMAVRAHSAMDFYKAAALRELGRHPEADAVLADLIDDCRKRLERPATVDYFATSLPDLLVFDADPDRAENAEALALWALAALGRGDRATARQKLTQARHLDPAHANVTDAARLLESGELLGRGAGS